MSLLLAEESGTGPPVVTGSATLTAVASLVASALLIIPATATVSAAASLTGAGIVEVHAGAQLTAASSLAGAGLVEVNGAATLVAGATLSAAALVEVHGGATLDAAGVLTASGEVDEDDQGEPGIEHWGPSPLRWTGPRRFPWPRIVEGAVVMRARGTLTAKGHVVPGTEAPLVLALFMLMED